MTDFLNKYKRFTIKNHPDAGVVIFMEQYDGSGALTTSNEFERFVPGFAHITSEGEIMRYGEVIGDRNDLIKVDDAEEIE